ncbi:helix-turn-helix domain-containing protein [Peribacillus saganii]|uniref:helix-turn-helix domain-containing protein n=1 Tax=Peribacillus saganii TaxID=2303992 RepID=UPI0018F1F575|nr:helix-turn-helix domain-containing protein [Peribacillus saganii]
MKNKTKLVLHPVRMEIIQSLLNGKTRTVQQLSGHIKDVPQATLYRHLNKLLEADLIEILEEHRVQGTVEKVYGLKQTAVLSQGELAELSIEDHLEFFSCFKLHS